MEQIILAIKDAISKLRHSRNLTCTGVWQKLARYMYCMCICYCVNC